MELEHRHDKLSQRYTHRVSLSGAYTMLTFILKINIGTKKPNRWAHLLFDSIFSIVIYLFRFVFNFHFKLELLKLHLKSLGFRVSVFRLLFFIEIDFIVSCHFTLFPFRSIHLNKPSGLKSPKINWIKNVAGIFTCFYRRKSASTNHG